MHIRIHSNKPPRHCHYFNNGKICPFEELGCKFLHVLSTKCKFDKLCHKTMCSYKHSEEGTTVTDHEHSDEKEVVENSNESELGNSDELTMVTSEEEISDIPIDIGDEVMDKTDEIPSFCTSTPKDHSPRCEECLDRSQCADCIVKHMFKMHVSLRKQLF